MNYYVIQKRVKAASIPEALEKEKGFPVHSCWLDADGMDELEHELRVEGFDTSPPDPVKRRKKGRVLR